MLLRRVPATALLAALLAGAAASSSREADRGDDSLSLVQQAVRAESDRSVLSDVLPPLTVPGGAQAPLPSFYDDDGKAPAGQLSDVGKSAGAALGIPQYTRGEHAEIISLQGDNIGTWLPAIVAGPSQAADTYQVYVPSAPESHRVIPDIPGKYLRKDKPDAASVALAAQAESYAATIKRQMAQAKLRAQTPTVRISDEAAKKQMVGQWLVSKGLIPGMGAAAHGKYAANLLDDGTGEKVKGLEKFLNMVLATPAPVHMQSQREEFLNYLEHNATDLPPEVVEELRAKAKMLAEDAPPPDEATQLQAVAPSAAPGLETEEDRGMLHGVWEFGVGNQAFTIYNVSCTMQFDGALAAKGERLKGPLRHEGEWLIGNLTGQNGQPGGMVRIRHGEDPGTAAMSFRDTGFQREFGQLDWSGEVEARRTGRASDEIPGKCTHKKYGCWCENGKLRLPDIFIGKVGEDVEVFKGDGSGWYHCIITGADPPHSIYTIYIPDGPVNARTVRGITSDWLRHPKVTPPPPPQPEEQTGAAAAAQAALALKSSVPQPSTTAARQAQEEQAPVTALATQAPVVSQQQTAEQRESPAVQAEQKPGTASSQPAATDSLQPEATAASQPGAAASSRPAAAASSQPGAAARTEGQAQAPSAEWPGPATAARPSAQGGAAGRRAAAGAAAALLVALRWT